MAENWFRKLILPKVRKRNREEADKVVLKTWEAAGCPIPPPHRVKQLAVESYQSKYQIQILVETGTYLGDMVTAEIDNFQQIYSIELDLELWKQAVRKFKQHSHVVLLQGDSGVVLQDLVPKLKQKTIFWLDGHYSGGITAKGDKECPIMEELTAIMASPYEHIILIDDARCFDGDGDYPTINTLKAYLTDKREISSFSIQDDIIRVEFA